MALENAIRNICASISMCASHTLSFILFHLAWAGTRMGWHTPSLKHWLLPAQYYKDKELSFPEYISAQMAEEHLVYNGFGHKNIVAHHFDLEAELLYSLAKAGYIRHCTAKGCRGKELPWPAQSLLQPVSILEYEGSRIKRMLPASFPAHLAALASLTLSTLLPSTWHVPTRRCTDA